LQINAHAKAHEMPPLVKPSNLPAKLADDGRLTLSGVGAFLNRSSWTHGACFRAPGAEASLWVWSEELLCNSRERKQPATVMPAWPRFAARGAPNSPLSESPTGLHL